MATWRKVSPTIESSTVPFVVDPLLPAGSNVRAFAVRDAGPVGTARSKSDWDFRRRPKPLLLLLLPMPDDPPRTRVETPLLPWERAAKASPGACRRGSTVVAWMDKRMLSE